MSSIKNKIQLIGNIGKDVDITTFESGNKVAKVSLATNESYTNKNNDKVTSTQWHNLVAWGKTADILEKFVKKGDTLGIEGKLEYRDYDDKKGVNRRVAEIIVSEVFLFPRGKTNGEEIVQPKTEEEE